MLTAQTQLKRNSFKYVTDSDIQIAFSKEAGIANLLSQQKFINLKSNNFILTDENVADLHLESMIQALSTVGILVHPIVVPPHESSKSLSVYGQCVDSILRIGVDKYSTIISFGGGVVNNLAGFLASTIYRGINLVHIPTTTLAQSDAAIDVKQAINSTFGKNTIGAYYPPQLVVISTDFLKTLPSRYFYDGFAEVIKHALCQDREFVQNLMSLDISAVPLVSDSIEFVIRRTVELKIEVMGEYANKNLDLHDYNEAIKQYGHSLGHAIEHASHHDLMHGESIAIGMIFSAFVAVKLGISDQDTLARHINVFDRFNLPTCVPNSISTESLMDYVRYDKHFADGRVSIGLLEAVGRPHFSAANVSYFVQITLADFEKLLVEFRKLKKYEDCVGDGR